MTLDPEVARAEALVVRTREQLSRSVLALRRAMVKKSDWHEWVSRRPALFLTSAFLLGILLGQRLSRRRDSELK